MKKLALGTFVACLGLCLALGACKKKEEAASSGGGTAAPATPAADGALTVTPENIEKILAKADELVTEEIGGKVMNGNASPEEGLAFVKLQEQAVQAGGLTGEQLMAWVEFLMKEENSAYQMRWVTILMGQPDTKQ